MKIFRCSRMPPLGADITVEQCEKNRKSPMEGAKLTFRQVRELDAQGIERWNTMPKACELCKDWPKLCAAAREVEQGEEELMRSVPKKEVIRTAVEIEKAVTLEAATKALTIGNSTLRYRIHKYPELYALAKGKGWVRDKGAIGGDALAGKAPKETAPGKDEKAAQYGSPETKSPGSIIEGRGQEGLPPEEQFSGLFSQKGVLPGLHPLSEGVLLSTSPTVKIHIEVDGLDLSKLPELLRAVAGMQEQGIQTR